MDVDLDDKATDDVDDEAQQYFDAMDADIDAILSIDPSQWNAEAAKGARGQSLSAAAVSSSSSSSSSSISGSLDVPMVSGFS